MSGERTMRPMSQESGNRRRPERRVGSQIQREVVQLILDRGLRAGAPLPTETELMEDLGVSRNSVREALSGLRFGSVSLTVHEGRVVQIDVTEKKRLFPN